MIKKKKIINPASHNRKTKQAYFLFFPPPPPPLPLHHSNSTEKFSWAWAHHGNGDVSRIIRHCDARASERAWGREGEGSGRGWRRVEMYLGICRPAEVTQDDGFGDGFWVRGGGRRQESGYWNRVVALTVRPTYDSSSPSPPLFLSLPQWRNRDREPPCHVGLGQFREELPNCLQLLQAREQWAKRGGIGRRRTARDP